MAHDALHESSWPATASRWLLAAGIGGAAAAVGTVHALTLCVIAAVLGTATFLAWWGAEPMRVRTGVTVLLFAGVGLTAYTALQCVPLPAAWLTAIAPHNADVWARALSPLHDSGPRWTPLSVDPIATRVEVLRGVVYLLAFLTAVRIARSREGVGFLSAVLVVTALGLALAAVLHPAFGARRLFGVYDPGPYIPDRHVAPMMNPNNLAGYLSLALCLSLAAALGPERKVPRPILVAAAVMLGAAEIWVASRGGVISAVLGAIIVVTATLFARSRNRRSGSALSWITALGVLFGAGLIVLSGSEEASSELINSDTSKLQLFAQFMRMLPAVPFFGCGRGAFESAFPVFRTDVGYLTYQYPENFVAQWVLEWGVPVGVLGFAAIAFSLRPTAMLARSTTAVGAWAGLVAVSVQNLEDLGSEVPGLVLGGVICAAIVVGGSTGRQSSWKLERWALRPRRVSVVSALVTSTALAAVIFALPHQLHRDQRALSDAARDGAVQPGHMHDMAREAMLRHPAEPYIPYVTAARALNRGDDNPLPWIEATLERARVYPPAHVILARLLTTRSPAQARLAYRMAVEQAPDLLREVAPQALPLVHGYDDALELVPRGAEGTAMLGAIVPLLQERLPATCVRLDAELLSRAPDESGPALRAAAAAVDDLEGPSAWCDGDANARCVAKALDLTARAEALTPGHCEARALHARARAASGEAAAGLGELSDSVDAVAERVECLRDLVLLAQRSHDDARVTEGLSRITAAGCSGNQECAYNLAWVAIIEERRGNSRKALLFYRRASERSPDNTELLRAVARLAADTGLHTEAATTYERLAILDPSGANWRELALRERNQALKTAAER